MATQYPGTEADVTEITIPDDNDVADAESVNRAFRALRDSIKLGLATQNDQPLNIRSYLRSTDFAKIDISPLSTWIQQNRAFLPYRYAQVTWNADSFTVLDVDTGGASFDASTVYYCYIGWDNVALTFKRKISKNIPDEKLVFQKANSFLKYVGSFHTDSFKRVVPYSKEGDYYTLDNPFPVLSTSGTTLVTANLSSFLPTYARKVRLRIKMINTSTAATDKLLISAVGAPDFQEIVIGKGADVQQMVTIDLPLRTNREFQAKMDAGGSAIGIISLEGWWER